MVLPSDEKALFAARRARIMERLESGVLLLAALAGHADAAEGAMMRAMAERFRQAVARGALGEAKETADVMRARSGSVLAPKKPR